MRVSAAATRMWIQLSGAHRNRVVLTLLQRRLPIPFPYPAAQPTGGRESSPLDA